MHLPGLATPQRKRDLAIVSILTVSSICAYAQLAKEFCEGGPNTGSLPADSFVLRRYPCKGSGVQRAAHILLRSPWVLHDYCRLQLGDLWLSAAVGCWLARLVLALCIPDPLYSSVIAPSLTYAARDVAFPLNLAWGPAQKPTRSTVSFLFNPVNTLFDICVLLTIQTPSWYLEAVHGVACAACAALLCSWHQPEVGTGVWTVITLRLLITCANLLITHCIQRHHRTSRDHTIVKLHPGSPDNGVPPVKPCKGAGVGLDGAVDAGTCTPVAASTPCQGSRAPGVTALAGGRDSDGRDGGAVARIDDTGTRAALGRAGATAGAAPRADKALTETGPATPRQRARNAAAATVGSGSGSGSEHAAPGGSASAGRASAAACADAVAGITYVAQGSSAACASTAKPASAPGSGSRRPPRYAPFLARSTHLVKLPGHSPDQLAPGWEDRLREAVAARGRVLAGAYVRAGCIELVLEIQEMVSEAESAWAPKNGASGGGTAGSGHDGTGDAWLEGNPAFLAALREALGLPAPAEAAEAGRPAQKLVTSASLLRGAFSLPPGPVFTGVCGPAQQQQQGHLWLSLSPRVAVLPPAGEAGSLTLRLRLTGLPPAAVFIGEEGGSGNVAVKAATNVAAAPGAGSGEPSASAEVLVRSRGSYLPALLRRLDVPAAGPSGGAGAGSSAVWLELELALGGLTPGLLQVDVRLGGVPCCALPVLVLPAGEGELAAELRGVEAAAADAEVEAAGGVQHDTLGDLLYDIGALLYGGAGVRTCGTSSASVGLAAHLLAYAEGAGLKALAAAVRGTGAECGAADDGCAAAAAAGPGRSSDCGSAASAPSGPAPPREPSAGRRPLSGCVWSDVRSALLLSAGLAREGPEEAEDFRAAAADWAAGQAHIIQALEVSSALALLRRHSDPRVGTLLLWLLRISASLITAAAWPLLPPARWRRLAVVAHVPRYGASLVCKALALRLGLQPGLAALYPGVGLLFAEGLLLPATCPLPLAASLALSALRLPLNAGLMSLGLSGGGGGGGSGGGDGGGAPAPLPRIAIGWRALLLAARVEVVALATTLACHVYLRLMCGRRRAGRALVAQQQAGQVRQMGDKRETCTELWRDETCQNS